MKNKEYSAEELRAAIAYRAKNPLHNSSLSFALLLQAGVLDRRIEVAKLVFAVKPRETFAAIISYGMDLAAALDDLSECAPGDYHCLEHKEKNCECCETTSQLGKPEMLNPPGPKYF